MTTTEKRTHTPGPWQFSNNHIWTWFHKDLPEGPVAFMNLENPTNDANARLIAAAPDLLAACERVVRAENSMLSHRAKTHRAALNIVRTAIAKATTD